MTQCCLPGDIDQHRWLMTVDQYCYSPLPSTLLLEVREEVLMSCFRYNGTFPEIQPLQGIDFSQYGAYHASEIPIVFGTYAGFGKIPESGKRLSELMQNSK